MKINYLLHSILIFCFLFISSCSVPIRCIFYNNADSSVTITQSISGEVKSTVLIEGNESYIFKEWEYSEYFLEKNGDVFILDDPKVPLVGGDYVEYRGALFWGKRIIKVQLEDDNSTYILRVEEDFPLSDFSNQPEGFPIKLSKRDK